LTAVPVAATRGSQREDRAGSTWLWKAGRLLLVISVAPLALASWAALAPVSNPGVQNCGAPVVFVAEGRTNVRLPRIGDPAHDETTPVLAAQPRCNERVDERLIWTAIWGGMFVAVALLGALLGLLDDRRALRRSARFQELLREPPPDAPGPLWDRPIVPVEELGRDLPRVEREDVEGMVVWGLAATVVLPVVVGAGATLTALGGTSLAPLLVAALLSAALPLIAAGPLSAASAGHVPYRRAGLVAGAGGYLVPILPAFGWSGLQAHVLARLGVPAGESRRRVGAITITAFVAHAVVLLVLTTLMAGRGWPGAPPPRAWLVVGAVGLSCAVGIGLAPVRWRRLVIPVDASVVGTFAALRREPGALLTIVLAAAVRPVVAALVLVATTSATGGGVPVAVVLVIALGAVAVGALSPMVEGLFAQDAVVLLALSMAGMPPGAAMAATLLWRGVALWIPMAAGAVMARRLRWSA
jgi:uncharacterized membrane protein YbhN (UPF0104 family)